MALGICCCEVLVGGRFLMSEIPLYAGRCDRPGRRCSYPFSHLDLTPHEDSWTNQGFIGSECGESAAPPPSERGVWGPSVKTSRLEMTLEKWLKRHPAAGSQGGGVASPPPDPQCANAVGVSDSDIFERHYLKMARGAVSPDWGDNIPVVSNFISLPAGNNH